MIRMYKFYFLLFRVFSGGLPSRLEVKARLKRPHIVDVRHIMQLYADGNSIKRIADANEISVHVVEHLLCKGCLS